MKELTKLIADNYDDLCKLVQEVAPLFTHQKEETHLFFEERRAEMTEEDVLQVLWYINRAPYFKKNKEQIADDLLRIPYLVPRIQNGDFTVLRDVATAFCIGKHLRITHVQYAMTFCALINPKQFPRFDKAVLSLMSADGVDITQFVHNGIIFNGDAILGIAFFVKNFYDAIKDNTQDCNYADIHSVLTTIWKVLIDPRVIDAAIAGTLRVGLGALGLPPAMSFLLAKLLSMGLVDLLRPQLEAYRRQYFRNQITFN